MSSDTQPVSKTESVTTEQKIIDWLLRKTKPVPNKPPFAFKRAPMDDWQTVASLCGHQAEDFLSAEIDFPPLTASEIDYFRRNHREIERFVCRDFLVAQADLPSPLAELYGLYRHRARIDTEATFFVAQASGSVRVARVMADLLAIGGFANALEFVAHMTMTYAVSAAFDTSDLIDRANQEAERRLGLPVDHPAHLLTLSPDEISVLAGNIVERHVLSAQDFLEKANLLAEARQDVNRLPASKQFITSIGDRDLPLDYPWVSRICAAYARIFENWVLGMPEIEALIKHKAEVKYQ